MHRMHVGQARNAITLLKKQLDDATVGSSTSEHQGFQVANRYFTKADLIVNRCGFRKSVARIHKNAHFSQLI